MNGARLVSILAVVSTAGACGTGAKGTGGAGGDAGAIFCGPGMVEVDDKCLLATGPDAGDDGSSDAGDAGDEFPCGICVPGQPINWSYPLFGWFGDQADAPGCPVSALAVGYEGFADLNAPTDCGTCTCGAPSGSCTLPATMTANAATCTQNGASTAHTAFNPASGWSGGCDTNESIPSGKLCSGADCVQSLTVAPLTLTETSGTPSQPPAQSTPTWGSYALVCQRNPFVGCPDNSGEYCLPPPPAGFQVCIGQFGTFDCSDPANLTPLYSETHVTYGGYDDTRACSPCTCGAVSGSTCSSTISVYTDGACSTLAYSAPIDATGPACQDLPPGTPLGSKSATPPTYTPGTCAPSGGTPMGAATPNNPFTLCCIPAQ